MSIYQCEKCGCAENTACGATGRRGQDRFFDWSGIEEHRGKKLCSVCGPTKYKDGEPTKYGKWHGNFERLFLPLGEFHTGDDGNLYHTASGLLKRDWAEENPSRVLLCEITALYGIPAVAQATGVSEKYIKRCLASERYTIHRVKLANAKKALDKPQAVG